MLGRMLSVALVGGAGLFLIAGDAFAGTDTIKKPMFNGKRLDWCASWTSDCGKPAADAFCKSQGYAEATKFERDPHIGSSSPTRVISTGAVCDLAHCDGFLEITCAKLPTVAPEAPVEADAPADNKADAESVVTEAAPAEAATPADQKEIRVIEAKAPEPVAPPEDEAAPAEEVVAGDSSSGGSAASPEDKVPVETTAADASESSEAAGGEVAAAEPSVTDETPAPAAVAAAEPAAAEEPVPAPAKPVRLASADPSPAVAAMASVRPPVPQPKPTRVASVARPAPVTQVFQQPLFGGKRLDWCRGWKDTCGQATADDYCRYKGFVRAVAFAPDMHIGHRQPTRQIATGMVCDQEMCDGFKIIACAK